MNRTTIKSKKWSVQTNIFYTKRNVTLPVLAFILIAAVVITLYNPFKAAALQSGSPAVSGVAHTLLGEPDMTTFGNLSAASLTMPHALAIDASGRIYVADTSSPDLTNQEVAANRVLIWNNINALSTGKPADVVIGSPNFRGSGAFSGNTSAANLSGPTGIAVDSTGNLYVADKNNNRVLKFNAPLTTGKSASVVYGQGGDFTTSTSGTTNTTLNSPTGVFVDGSNNLFVADSGNNRVLKFLSGSTTATTVFGQVDFTHGCANLSASTPCDDPPPAPTSNSLNNPTNIFVDASNNLYVADKNNNRVLKFNAPLTTGMNASVVYGQADFTHGCPNRSAQSPCADPPPAPTSNTFNSPTGVFVDGANNLYVTDSVNNRVLRFASGNTNANFVYGQLGAMTTDTTNKTADPDVSAVSADGLNLPWAVILDGSNNLYIADTSNNRVTRYASGSTTANLVLGQTALDLGGANGIADAFGFSQPTGIAIDKSVIPNRIYIADTGHNRVLAWNNVDTLYNNPATPPDRVIGQPNVNSTRTGTTASTLNAPWGVVTDKQGNLYVSDEGNNRILIFFSPFTTDLVADRVIGQPDFVTTGCSDPTPYTICRPEWMGIDTTVTPNRLVVSDAWDLRVLGYSNPINNPAANMVVGQVDLYSNANNINHPTRSQISNPTGVEFDADGTLYLGDNQHHRLLLFYKPFDTDSLADVVLGQVDFTHGESNQGGNPTARTMNWAKTVSIDPSGNLYFGDRRNTRVTMWKKTNNPLVTNQAADGEIGQVDFTSSVLSNDPNTFYNMLAVVTDSAGRLYVSDETTNRVQIFPANAPANLGFTNPQYTINAGGVTSKMHLHLLDSFGNRIVSPNSVTINLSTNSSGTDKGFSTSPTGPFNQTSVTLPAYSPGVDIYYHDTKAGSQTITASAVSPAFTANQVVTVLPVNAATATITGGDAQTAGLYTQFTNPLQVTVKDIYQNPVSGVLVNFTAPSSNASVTFNGSGTNLIAVMTDANGLASTGFFTANGTAGGPYTITAKVSGLSSTLSFTNITNGTAFSTPTIATLSPPTVTAGTLGFYLTVKGTNFTSQSTVTVGGASKTVTYLNPTTLLVQLDTADLVAVGTPGVIVSNPGPVSSGSTALSIVAGCQDLVVTKTGADDGLCGSFTWAVSHATANQVISFALPITLSPSFTPATINLAAGVSMNANNITFSGTCTPNGPGIVIRGGTGNGITIPAGTKTTFYGLKIAGFSLQQVIANRGDTQSSCFSTSKN